MARNVKTTLRRRHAPMAQFDRLPEALRHWLAQAALPWSPQSVLRQWHAALRATGGNHAAAFARLSQLEARMLARDAARIWGEHHPTARMER